jgi:hypothetical protein
LDRSDGGLLSKTKRISTPTARQIQGTILLSSSSVNHISKYDSNDKNRVNSTQYESGTIILRPKLNHYPLKIKIMNQDIAKLNKMQILMSTNVVSKDSRLRVQNGRKRDPTPSEKNLSTIATEHDHHSSFDSDAARANWGISSLLFLSYLAIFFYAPSSWNQFSTQELCWAATNAYIVTLVASTLRREARSDQEEHHRATCTDTASCKDGNRPKRLSNPLLGVNTKSQSSKPFILSNRNKPSTRVDGRNNFIWILSTCQKVPIIVDAKKKHKSILKSTNLLSGTRIDGTNRKS